MNPWLNEKIYAPYKLAALIETLGEFGVPSQQVLQGTSLAPAQVDDPETRTSVGQYFTACRNAVRLGKNARTPFLVGGKMHLSAYGMYGYALMCSLTLRNVFEQGVKYHRLATPTVVMEWREDEGKAIWSFPRLVSPELSADLHGFLIEQQLVQNCTHFKEVAGPECLPLRAILPYPPPTHHQLYEEYLGCPVIFNGNACELQYEAEILDKPTQQAHKLTSTLMQATCERLIGQAKMGMGLSGQIYQLIMASPGRIPTMEQVAEMTGMNERTLRRKLEADGTSFAGVVDDVRATLASEYLKTTKMTIEDVAALVGFSDAANFRRAFKRWTGKTPTDFRNLVH